MLGPSVRIGSTAPYIELECRCGWTGYDCCIEDWMVEHERDRVVRRCPKCENPVPEWGTLQPIEAAARIATGALEASIQESHDTTDG